MSPPAFGRRRVLQLCGVLSTSAIAGRLVPTTTNLEEIDVVNRTDEAQAVHVLVESDGELVTWTTVTLAPAVDGGSGEDDDSERLDSWPDDRGRFTVHTRLDGRDSWVTTAYTPQPTTRRVVDYQVTVHVVERDGEAALDVSVFV